VIEESLDAGPEEPEPGPFAAGEPEEPGPEPEPPTLV
jgi:hypothetical protein